MQEPDLESTPRRSATFPALRALLLSIPISILIIGIYVGLFWLLWGKASPPRGSFLGPLFFFVFLGVGIVAHELLHALGWKWAGNLPWGAMKFGFNWKVLAPYAHCTRPLSAKAYRIGIVLPGFALGILPGVVGLLTGEYVVTFWGALFTSAASGDLLGFWAIRSLRSEARVIDHPTEIGCEVLEE